MSGSCLRCGYKPCACARPGERKKIGKRLYEIGNLDGSISWFRDLEEDGKQKRVRLSAWSRESAIAEQREILEMDDDAFARFCSKMSQAMGDLEWAQNEQLAEILLPLYDQLQALQSDNRKLRQKIERDKGLKRERDARRKDKRKENDRAKRADPYVKLAKLDILAEEGATEAERENARLRASELRGRLMGNAA